MLALQINNQWVVLSEDQSVTIEENSPVWGEGNTFSLPFELNVEANRHILGNSDQLTGMSVYDVLEGQPATLYVMGIPLFYGKLSLEDEVEIADGTVEVSLISSTLAFNDMIDGMNCQDVELTEEIVLGEKLDNYTINLQVGTGLETFDTVNGFLPNHFMRMRNNGVDTVNVSNSYPAAKYCNTRICYQLPEQLEDGEKGPEKEIEKVAINVDDKYLYKGYKTYIEEKMSGKYVVLDADRALSAPCFYVLYFMECLFKKLSIDIDFSKLYNNDNSSEDDICRLAFFNTSCKFKDGLTSVDTSFNIPHALYDGFQVLSGSWNYPVYYWKWKVSGLPGIAQGIALANMAIFKTKCIATSKNFPKVDCSQVVEALENGFGIRFLFDKQNRKVTPVYVRDVLTDKDVKSVNAEVIDVYKVENNTRGFLLKYSGDDEDTSFNYNEWNNVSIIGTDGTDGANGFNQLQKNINAFDKTCYVDQRNGNAYRTNDSDATDLESQNPALFEVGMFNSVKYGDCSDENRVHEVEIAFTPIVMNDTEFETRKDKLRGKSRNDSTIADKENNEQGFAVFLDVEMKYPSLTKEQKITGEIIHYSSNLNTQMKLKYDIYFTYVDIQRYDEKMSKGVSGRDKKVGYNTPLKYLDNDSPIQTFDAGLTLGIMRGPGNTSGTQEYDQDYDEEGNSKYVAVPTNYAFHSDTVDNYGRVFDYDGAGNYTGVDTSRRFSLKLRAEKPYPDVLTEEMKEEIEAAGLQKWSDGKYYHPISESYARRRGLFDKFYTEYAHFVTHRKIAKLTLRMEIADLVNIDWTKRYRIGDFIGFINHYSYTVSASGISEVEMELYYI